MNLVENHLRRHRRALFHTLEWRKHVQENCELMNPNFGKTEQLRAEVEANRRRAIWKRFKALLKGFL